MAVLLSYHRLIEKDSRNVNYCWKASILAVLCISVASSLVISFSVHNLAESFNQNCFMGANVSFIAVPRISMGHLFERANSTEESQILYKLLSSVPTDEKQIIDELGSIWSDPDFCEYLTYTPLFHALLGVIWLAIFVMHGHGGEGIGSIIAKPWRIVFPSLLFFTVCGISALICACFTSGGLAQFCQQFKKIDEEIDCARMISFFSMSQNNDLVLPDKNYYLVAAFPWFWVGCYLCGFLIMLLRILLVIDFQLIRVVVSTIVKETSSESDLPSIEQLQETQKVSTTL